MYSSFYDPSECTILDCNWLSLLITVWIFCHSLLQIFSPIFCVAFFWLSLIFGFLWKILENLGAQVVISYGSWIATDVSWKSGRRKVLHNSISSSPHPENHFLKCQVCSAICWYFMLSSVSYNSYRSTFSAKRDLLSTYLRFCYWEYLVPRAEPNSLEHLVTPAAHCVATACAHWAALALVRWLSNGRYYRGS